MIEADDLNGSGFLAGDGFGSLIVLALLVALVTYFGVGLVRILAVRHQVLDIPTARSSHDRPTPRGGGFAIVLVSLIAFATAAIWRPEAVHWCVYLVLGGAVVACVSLLDDLRSLPVAIRLTAHLGGALVAIAGIGALQTVGLPSGQVLYLGSLSVPLTVLWVVGLVNAYNFMDGIDGIAASQAIVAGLGWFLLGETDPTIRALGLLLAASSAAFLLHNWPPAKIFMGDVGSAFIGYLLAVMTLIASQKDARFAVVGLLLVWPFVFDTLFTFLRRVLRGENVLSSHRGHLYQRLVIAGFSHRFVTLLYAALAVLGLGLAKIWLSGGPVADVIAAGGLGAACAALWAFVRWAEKAPRLVQSA